MIFVRVGHRPAIGQAQGQLLHSSVFFQHPSGAVYRDRQRFKLNLVCSTFYGLLLQPLLLGAG